VKYTQDPQYDLFFNYHYTIETTTSLRPVYTSNGLVFNSYDIIKRKKLSIIDKLRYYYYDLLLFYKTRKDDV